MKNLAFVISVTLSVLFFPISSFALKPIHGSPEEVSPITKGETIPATTLHKMDGSSVNLMELVSQKPSVLIFYRGGWCIYCNRHLGQLKKIEKDLEKLGYQIIAISPDRPEKIKEHAKQKQKDINYLLLSDSSAETIRKFGLAFRLDDATFGKYKNDYGIDIEKDSGQPHHILPVPAAFVIDQKGKIAFVYFNPNYKVRISAEELLKAAKEAKKNQ